MEYEQFEQEMNGLLEDYKEFVLWLKDNIKSLKDILRNFYEVIPKVMLIWGATKAVATGIEDLPSSVQRNFFSEYLDGVFEFKNIILEGVDRYVFELVFFFLEYFGDKVFPTKDEMTFEAFAAKALSMGKKGVKVRVVPK